MGTVLLLVLNPGRVNAAHFSASPFRQSTMQVPSRQGRREDNTDDGGDFPEQNHAAVWVPSVLLASSGLRAVRFPTRLPLGHLPARQPVCLQC